MRQGCSGGQAECLEPAPHPVQHTGKEERKRGYAWPQGLWDPCLVSRGGAVTRLRVDNTIFYGCRLQILGKDPFLLGQQSDDVGAGTGLGSLRPGGAFHSGSTQSGITGVADVGKGLEEEVQGGKDSVDTNSGGDSDSENRHQEPGWVPTSVLEPLEEPH